jgi:Cof subfamily protein (haloacid dehalogenase superfamily)
LREPPAYDLLVLDIDGTLVPEDKVVPPGVVAAIAAARARGVRVCLATGRMWASARKYVEIVGADPPAILFNGGLLYDFTRDRVIWSRALALTEARRILPVLLQFQETSPLVFVQGKVFAGRRTPFTDLYARRNGLVLEFAPDLTGLLTEAPMKFLVVGAPPDLERLSRALAALPPPAVNQVYSQPDYLEVLPPGIDKGVALRELARTVGVPLERVVAVGDAMNDLALVQTAGYGVAVEGGPPPLLAAAKWICPRPEQEGVRVVIERLFPNR